MKWLYTLAVLGGALMLAGCAMETDTSGDQDEPEAVNDAESAITIANIRLRNAATSLCLSVNTSLTVLATAPCSNTSAYVRWNIVEEFPMVGDHSIHPKSDPSKCVQALSPDPGSQPTIGPCAPSPADKLSAGQLFYVIPVGGGKYMISPHFAVPPSAAVYLTALQPNDVNFDVWGSPSLAQQQWSLF